MSLRGAGGGKAGGEGARTPVEAKDSLHSSSFAQVLDLICEGEIEGLVSGLQSVYLDGTPIENEDGTFNFTGVTIETVTGTQGQLPIPGFNSVASEKSVNVEILKNVPVTRTITDGNVDAARVRIAIPGLSKQDSATGDLNGSTVQISIDVQSNGGGFVPQNISFIWVASNTPSVQAAIGLQIAVSWPIPSGRGITFPTITFSVQYRLVGAGGWTVLKDDAFTPHDSTIIHTRGRQLTGGPARRTYTKQGLASGIYEAQVVKTSGTGTVSIEAFYIYVATPISTITGKATSTYQRSYRIELAGSPPWDVRVNRVTDDSASVLLRNRTFFDSYAELIDEKLSYPNSAIVGLSIDAKQFSAIPTRAYDMKLLRVKIPSNYDPVTREYTGVWDGTFVVAWTDNPAWCFYDLLTNARYGLGHVLTAGQVDKWALYTIGVYCDGLVPDGNGGAEPRLTCNIYLQTQQEAFQVIGTMASVFRGMAYWAAGAITAVQDAPADPVFLFTEANVVDGSFSYSGSAKAARHTVAIVSWNDPQEAFKLKPEYVESREGIARYGFAPVSVTAVGCTSRGQARRVGEWLLYSEQNETEVVIFRCGHDGTYVRPGSIIAVQDQHRAGVRYGGRVVSSTVSSVTIDAALTIVGGQTYTIQVVLPDGTLITKSLTNGVGSHTVLTVSENFVTQPLVNAMWLVTSSALSPQLFRVISITEVERQTYEVTALEHNASKFDVIEQDLVLTQPVTSLIPAVPLPPQNIRVTEELTIADGMPVITAHLEWEPVNTAARYLVEYRRNEGNFQNLTETASASADIQAALVGTYDIRVTARNSLGVSSVPTTVTRWIFGKLTRPSNISGVLDLSVVDGNLHLAWNPITDLDLDYYEVRFGTYWGLGGLIGRVKEPKLQLSAWSDAQFYQVKPIDTTGNESISATSKFIDTDAPIEIITFSQLEEFDAWPGVFTQTQIVSTPDGLGGQPWSLSLAGTIQWDDLTNAWDTYTGLWDDYYDPYESGTYESSALDLGVVNAAKVDAFFIGEPGPRNHITPGQDIADLWNRMIEPWLAYTVPPLQNSQKNFTACTIEIALNQTAGPGGWTAYTPWTIGGRYTFRQVKFRLTLSTLSKAYRPVIRSLQFMAIALPRTQELANQVIQSGGSTVSYGTQFYKLGTIQGTLRAPAIGDTFRFTSPSIASVTVTIYDSAGATKAGNIDLTVQGWGELP